MLLRLMRTCIRRIVLSDGYGGNVLQFKTDKNLVYAIHRPFTNDKKRDRLEL